MSNSNYTNFLPLDTTQPKKSPTRRITSPKTTKTGIRNNYNKNPTNNIDSNSLHDTNYSHKSMKNESFNQNDDETKSYYSQTKTQNTPLPSDQNCNQENEDLISYWTEKAIVQNVDLSNPRISCRIKPEILPDLIKNLQSVRDACIIEGRSELSRRADAAVMACKNLFKEKRVDESSNTQTKSIQERLNQAKQELQDLQERITVQEANMMNEFQSQTRQLKEKHKKELKALQSEWYVQEQTYEQLPEQEKYESYADKNLSDSMYPTSVDKNYKSPKNKDKYSIFGDDNEDIFSNNTTTPATKTNNNNNNINTEKKKSTTSYTDNSEYMCDFVKNTIDNPSEFDISRDQFFNDNPTKERTSNSTKKKSKRKRSTKANRDNAINKNEQTDPSNQNSTQKSESNSLMKPFFDLTDDKNEPNDTNKKIQSQNGQTKKSKNPRINKKESNKQVKSEIDDQNTNKSDAYNPTNQDSNKNESDHQSNIENKKNSNDKNQQKTDSKKQKQTNLTNSSKNNQKKSNSNNQPQISGTKRDNKTDNHAFDNVVNDLTNNLFDKHDDEEFDMSNVDLNNFSESEPSIFNENKNEDENRSIESASVEENYSSESNESTESEIMMSSEDENEEKNKNEKENENNNKNNEDENNKDDKKDKNSINEKNDDEKDKNSEDENNNDDESNKNENNKNNENVKNDDENGNNDDKDDDGKKGDDGDDSGGENLGDKVICKSFAKLANDDGENDKNDSDVNEKEKSDEKDLGDEGDKDCENKGSEIKSDDENKSDTSDGDENDENQDKDENENDQKRSDSKSSSAKQKSESNNSKIEADEANNDTENDDDDKTDDSEHKDNNKEANTDTENDDDDKADNSEGRASDDENEDDKISNSSHGDQQSRNRNSSEHDSDDFSTSKESKTEIEDEDRLSFSRESDIEAQNLIKQARSNTHALIGTQKEDSKPSSELSSKPESSLSKQTSVSNKTGSSVPPSKIFKRFFSDMPDMSATTRTEDDMKVEDDKISLKKPKKYGQPNIGQAANSTSVFTPTNGKPTKTANETANTKTRPANQGTENDAVNDDVGNDGGDDYCIQVPIFLQTEPQPQQKQEKQKQQQQKQSDNKKPRKKQLKEMTSAEVIQAPISHFVNTSQLKNKADIKSASYKKERRLRHYNKTSAQLRDLRRQAAFLIAENREDEARILQHQADQIEREEVIASSLQMQHDYEKSLETLIKRHHDEEETLKKNQQIKRTKYENAKQEGLSVLQRRIEKLENEMRIAADKERATALYQRKSSLHKKRTVKTQQARRHKKDNRNDLTSELKPANLEENQNEENENENENNDEYLNEIEYNDDHHHHHHNNRHDEVNDTKTVSHNFTDDTHSKSEIDEGQKFDMKHSLNRNAKRSSNDTSGLNRYNYYTYASKINKSSSCALNPGLNQFLMEHINVNVNRSLDKMNQKNPLARKRKFPTAVSMPMTSRRQVNLGEFSRIELPPLNASKEAQKVIKSNERKLRLNKEYM